MYRAVMEAVFHTFKYRRGEKEEWLRKFMKNGFYMIDATDCPVNRLSAAERRSILNTALNAKLSEIGQLVSPKTPIVLIKLNVFLAFAAPLRQAGFNVIHQSPLPFPSHGNQKRFIEACRACLQEHDRAK